MILAATLWALYLGQISVGVFPSFTECQFEAAWRLATQPQFKGAHAACLSGKTIRRFDEKSLPANLRKGKPVRELAK